MRFAKPLDTEMLEKLTDTHKLVVTLEENVISGGFGEHVTEFYSQKQSEVQLINIAIGDTYVEHGNVEILRRETGIDKESIIERIFNEYINIGQVDK